MKGNTRDQPAELRRRPLARVVLASSIGTFIEYYDYAVFGAVAPIIASLFFPSSDPTAGLLATFAVFGLAFVLRPVGAFIFGPMGDRLGRKKTLIIVIICMGLGTFIIGFLPTYSQAGIFAPILLVAARLVQGLSAGGELSGASIYVAESAPQNRRGLMTSWLQVANTVAFLPGLAIVAILESVLSDSAMDSWGWRIPFLVAGPLAFIGQYMRRRLEESPVFENIVAAGSRTRAPLKSTFTNTATYKDLTFIVFYGAATFVGFYFILTYLPTFVSTTLNYNSNFGILVVGAFCVGSVVAIPVAGLLSDIVGRKPVSLASCIGFFVLAYPAILLLKPGNVVLAVVAGLLLAIPTSGFQAVLLVTSLERFSSPIRYTGYGVGYALLSAIFGGTTPYVTESLTSASGNYLMPAYILMTAALISLVPTIFMRETAHRRLVDI
ncbi:MFS transporter [Spelaeicoccus albus]|uniref:Putative proline/betaine transporter n=1 Tax=Spelaeicoccus albus TaxID=1280376 RepID=A0A7Z0ABU5_9MICO|nr:MFS transporter [Spelaeicoccus albus]NYI66980.1 MHS family proline/betaine transporter-like MFS transporter [Spelaeicoccus albus]